MVENENDPNLNENKEHIRIIFAFSIIWLSVLYIVHNNHCFGFCFSLKFQISKN